MMGKMDHFNRLVFLYNDHGRKGKTEMLKTAHNYTVIINRITKVLLKES
jgi:hypothetical protein